MSDAPVDYYKILEIDSNATQDQIRTAYKKAALKWHPDRVPSDSPERPKRTKKFQQINDAYFTLSDASRRRDYDSVRQWESTETESEYADEDVPRPPPKKGGFNPFTFFGGGGAPKQEKAENEQWSSVFEEMMRDTGLAEDQQEDGQTRSKPTGRFWTVIGMIGGGASGYIIGNLPGAFIGGSVMAKLGGLRDTTGKSSYQTFQELPQSEKAKVLTELAAKVFAQAVSG